MNDSEEHVKNFSLGEIPLMVMSEKCTLFNNPDKLTEYNEDEQEVGGYFIVNGLEKILRNIIIPRKNYPIGIKRATFQNRRKDFSQYAVSIKSSNSKYLSQTLYLHYTLDGGVYLSLMIKKVEYLFPIAIIIKALADIPDLTFVELIDIPESNFNPVKLLHDAHSRDLKTRE